MDESVLRLHPGDALQLQALQGDDHRLCVKVIGYLPGRSLLVTTPTHHGKVMIMREGQPFVARVMVGNRVVGFNTTIVRSCARPYPYLHLAYPQEMEQIVVRQAQRIGVHLFASVVNDNPDYRRDKPQAATIVDLSTTGALVVAGEQLGEVGDAVVLNCSVKVAGIDRLLAIPALVRNVHREQSGDVALNDGYHHGLQFDIEDEHDAVTLHAFVYEHIARSLSE
ncbi:MAG TPA: flagellar brake protein [Gammaproteobacteria bacterium]|nr:flagellar brake protein [Gammaproteobacteria bacterium]